MRTAIIDLGTNTFNLLIADISENVEIICNQKIAVKLGEGGILNKVIAPPAFERGVNALKVFKEICNEHCVETIVAFGTSAVRSAINIIQFIDEIFSATNIVVTVIDGAREAELIYKGVKLGTQLNNKISLIMDIGGGSTEFIIANNEQLFWKQSFEIGASRLLETIKPSDIILDTEIAITETIILQTLAPLFAACEQYEIVELIGSSGSFDTFAEVIGFRKNEPLNLIENKEYQFNLDEFFEVHKLLLGSSYQQRLNTKGIIPIRAEMIVISGILTNFVLQKLNINKMRLSTYALKEGVLSEMIN